LPSGPIGAYESTNNQEQTVVDQFGLYGRQEGEKDCEEGHEKMNV
jgi:hypothetical protein